MAHARHQGINVLWARGGTEQMEAHILPHLRYHSFEAVVGFHFIFHQRIALSVTAQPDALAQIIEFRQLILPVFVDGAQQHPAGDLRTDFLALNGLFFLIRGFQFCHEVVDDLRARTMLQSLNVQKQRYLDVQPVDKLLQQFPMLLYADLFIQRRQALIKFLRNQIPHQRNRFLDAERFVAQIVHNGALFVVY